MGNRIFMDSFVKENRLSKFTLYASAKKPFFAVMITVCFFLVGLIYRNHFPMFLSYVAAIGVFAFLYWFLYTVFNRLVFAGCQKNTHRILKKIPVPLLIMDKGHRIIYTNEFFHRLPMSGCLLKSKNFPQFIAFCKAKHDSGSIEKIACEVKEELNVSFSKLKFFTLWGEHCFEWGVRPLLSPSGMRYGSLVECVCKTSNYTVSDFLPYDKMIEQFPIPLFLVDNQNNVLYVNLNLKLLLIRYRAYIKKVCEEFDIDKPSGDTLGYFLKLANQEGASFDSLVKLGRITLFLNVEQFDVLLHPIFNSKNEKLGVMVVWQAIENVTHLKEACKNSLELGCVQSEKDTTVVLDEGKRKAEAILLEGF